MGEQEDWLNKETFAAFPCEIGWPMTEVSVETLLSVLGGGLRARKAIQSVLSVQMSHFRHAHLRFWVCKCHT